MKLKRTLIAVGATGAAAAMAFGGSAVSTAFTSSADGSINLYSATNGVSTQNFDVNLSKLVPGDSVTKNISYTNTGSNPVDLTVTVNAPTTTGSDDNVACFEQAMQLSYGGADIALAKIVDGINYVLGAGTSRTFDTHYLLSPNVPLSGTVTFALLSTYPAHSNTTACSAAQNGAPVGNEASNAGVSLTFNVTGTATSAQPAPAPAP